jgi:hypothetical protein
MSTEEKKPPEPFVPPKLGYDARAAFADEYRREFPAGTDADEKRSWRLFTTTGHANVMMTNRVVNVIPEPTYRKVAIAWCILERAQRLRDEAERTSAEAKEYQEGVLGELKAANPNECIVLDTEHGCLRGHNCGKDEMHGGPDDGVEPLPGQSPIAQLLQRLIGEALPGATSKVYEIPRIQDLPPPKKGQSN